MESPAQIVIRKFGGHQAVADVVGIDVSTVYRWTYPTSKGGRNGLIPSRHQGLLLRAAQERRIRLRPKDLIGSLGAIA